MAFSFLFRDSIIYFHKEIHFALLKNIYGLGFRKAIFVSSKVGIGYPLYVRRVNSYRFNVLSRLLKDYVISDARIKRQVSFNISKLVTIDHIKGIRHSLFLPVHGQRTHTNAGTQRARRRSAANLQLTAVKTDRMRKTKQMQFNKKLKKR